MSGWKIHYSLGLLLCQMVTDFQYFIVRLDSRFLVKWWLDIQSHLKRVAIPCEMVRSENQRQSEQSHVAYVWCTCSGTFYYHFITNFCRVSNERIFKICQYLAKLYGQESWLRQAPVCTAGAMPCWEMNSREVWRMAGRSCCIITTWHITIMCLLLTLTPWSIRLVYYPLVDWCREWLTVDHERRGFIATSFFLVAASEYRRWFCRFSVQPV